MREAKARISPIEFEGWQAFYAINPWGESRADLRSAVVAHVMANAFRKKGARAFKPKDFMPDFEKPYKPKQPLKEIVSKLKAVWLRAKALGVDK